MLHNPQNCRSWFSSIASTAQCSHKAVAKWAVRALAAALRAPGVEASLLPQDVLLKWGVATQTMPPALDSAALLCCKVVARWGAWAAGERGGLARWRRDMCG